MEHENVNIYFLKSDDIILFFFPEEVEELFFSGISPRPTPVISTSKTTCHRQCLYIGHCVRA